MRSSSPGSWDFLTGGGELGALIRAFDWERTPLGRPESWPHSLEIAVRIMLTSRQPIWIGWGGTLTYLYNDPYKSIIGGKHPWALGRPAAEVWREIWPDIAPMLATAMTGIEGTYVEDQLLVMERNGYPEETYYTFSYSPIPNDDGSTGGIICANTDDTQRVIGERQLALLRALAAGTADARTREEATARSAAALGSNPRDLPFALLYMPAPGTGELSLCGASGVLSDDRRLSRLGDPLAWPLKDVLRGHEPVGCELEQLFGTDLPSGPWNQPPREAVLLPVVTTGETGQAGVLVVGLNPFRLYDEGYRGFLGLVAGQIGAAIANAEAYEAERRRAEALAEIDRAKTAFFSNVSHEFRTPLTLLLGPLEELLARPAERGAADRVLIDTAHRNAVRLLKLVNSLLDFSRIEAGRVQAHYEPTDLAAFSAELASIFRSAVDQAGLRLTIECSDLGEPVFVDREMWEKILLNLVSNAFKFTFAGEIAVTVRRAADGLAAELVVRDTGTGIPASELPHLFERFHRIEGARSRTFEGSGIGLALVQELVKLHGGAIRVDSEPDRGSIFVVRIPFGTAHLPEERIGGSPAGHALRARAYVEEALSWLPRAEPRIHHQEPDLLRTALDDFDSPVSATESGRVLLADDNADMREYVQRLLTAIGYEVEAVADGEAALAAIRRHPPDLVLTDVMMPVLDGFGLLGALRRDPAPELRDLPVLLLSARAGEEARIEGIDAGADDYLTKPFASRELLARVSTNLRMARMRREAMEALRARTIELETVLETVPTAVWFTYDGDARHAFGNRRAAELLRLPIDANPSLSAPAGERPAYRVYRHGDELAPAELPLPRAARGEEVRDEELEVRFPDGSSAMFLMSANPLRDAARAQVVGAVGAAIDITARKQAEEALVALNDGLEQRVAAEIERRIAVEAELRQAQKMEAIGQLTGGVAHDMNNLLLVIQGSLERIERRLAPVFDDGTSRAMQLAQRGVGRATSLTHQLLAFARRQPLDPKPIEANRLVASMSDLLRRTLGETIAIETVLAGGLWRTHADPNQLESAILNLAVNARDAMPNGGRLTIETANAYLDEDYAASLYDVKPGQYVMIAVSDTGTGMTKETIERAFEPFFTTKEQGKGTGLGLSQVYGFVKQSDGHIKLYSEPGEGTAVKIYLRRYTGDSATDLIEAEAAMVPRASEHQSILVVEDDEDVRAQTADSLRELGYRVVEAPDGPRALTVLDQDHSIKLLFTDVGLPGGMNGRQLADEARRRRPQLNVLFTTGYARNAIVHHGRLDPGVELIVKPYTYLALARKIKAMLAAAPQPPGPG
jgi:signal transduction histidine kinase/DNA-binding response OmpR family regulator